MGDNIVCGVIGFVLGGILGVYFAGRTCAREYKKRIDELTEQNTLLTARRREEVNEDFEAREKAVKKAEHKLSKSLKAQKMNAEADTKTFESLSKAYQSDAFDEHFSVRVAPDDSDDVGEEDDENVDENVDAKEDEDLDDPFDDEKEEEDPDAAYESIHMISEEQYKKDLEVRDSCTYTYYQEDGVLVDDITREVERDQAGILGQEGMECIADTEKDFLYIDNKPDDMLYEVAVDHEMSYYRDVLGF